MKTPKLREFEEQGDKRETMMQQSKIKKIQSRIKKIEDSDQ